MLQIAKDGQNEPRKHQAVPDPPSAAGEHSMVLYQIRIIPSLIDDPPSNAERHIDQIRHYVEYAVTGIGTWIAHNPNEFITAVSTAVIAWFTIVLAKSTVRLWRTTKDAAAQQAGDMKASLAVAETAARAAEKSSIVAERALVDIQRALVVPIKFSSSQIVRDSQVIAFYVTAFLENTGNTVAKHFTGSANFVMWDGNLPDDFKYPDRTAVPPARGFVGPHVVAPYPIGIAIQDIVDVMNKKRRGFFYGWVEYDDVFNTTSKRRTEFCAEIEVIGNPNIVRDKDAPTILGFGTYGRYNGTDDDCFYKPGERPPVGGLPPPTQPPPVKEAEL